jgi:hypothetical protein
MMRSRMTELPVPREWEEQVALVQWLNIHPILKELYLKNDNEGKRTPQQGFQAKRLGLKPGASDLFIFYPTIRFNGLWLEMKRNKIYTPSERNTVTWKAQEKFIKTVKSVGYQGHFCYGWEDAIRLINEYLLS